MTLMEWHELHPEVLHAEREAMFAYALEEWERLQQVRFDAYLDYMDRSLRAAAAADPKEREP